MFRAVPCSSSGGKIILLQPLVSSLSVQYAGWHIFRRTNCIITASGIVTLRKQLYSMPVGIFSGGQIVLLQPLVSSLSVNSSTVCRWRADCSPLSTCILYGCGDTRGCGDTIGPPDDEQRAARNMLRSVV